MAPALVALVGAALGCGCRDTTAVSLDASDEHGIIGNPTDASGVDASAPDAGMLTTTLRLANLSPDLGPIDFCYRAPAMQTFNGPVLSPGMPGMTAGDAGAEAAADASAETGDAAAPLDGGPRDATPEAASVPDASVEETGPDTGLDAGPPGVPTFQITSYLQLEGAGTFDFAIVRAGALTCDKPLYTAQATLDSGKSSTLALMGIAAAEAGAGDALRAVTFTDDPTVVMTSFRARFIDAAFGFGMTPTHGAWQVSLGGGMISSLGVVPLGDHSAPSSTPPVDPLGYLTGVPVSPPAALHLDAADDAGAFSWATSSVDLGLAGGSVHTGFIVSDARGLLDVLWCNESNLATPMMSCALLGKAGM